MKSDFNAVLRRAILTQISLEEKSLSDILKLFMHREIPGNSYFTEAGKYPVYFAYLCKGLVYSYLTDRKGNEIVKEIYHDGDYLIPLPPFIYRKPAILSFKILSAAHVFEARFTEMNALGNENQKVRNFFQELILREWIIKRTTHEADLHTYNAGTRFRIFKEKYGEAIKDIPLPVIASYLSLSQSQVRAYLAK